MGKSSTRSHADENHKPRDIEHLRGPKTTVKAKQHKKSTLVKRTIDKSAKTPRLVLKRLNQKDLLFYVNSAMTAEAKSNDTVTSQASESEDWHLCVSTTSEEDFQASPIHQNPNVCGELSSARFNSEPTNKSEMTP